MLRGLGKGGGFEETERYSLLDGSDPYLLDLISDRVEVVYNMLFEAEEDDDEDDVVSEDDDEDEEVDFDSLSALDKEILLAEREEADDEDEDISDLDEEVVE